MPMSLTEPPPREIPVSRRPGSAKLVTVRLGAFILVALLAVVQASFGGLAIKKTLKRPFVLRKDMLMPRCRPSRTLPAVFVSKEDTESDVEGRNLWKLSAESHSQTPTDRFHEDMRRVLKRKESIQTNLEELKSNSRTLERRARPPVMANDVDGAERVLVMLERMVEMGLATEETFQISMRAFLNRGRLRWWKTLSDRNHNQVICAADQLEELLDRLVAMLGERDVSYETFNLVLEAYAICSTPRGNRNYASRAEMLVKRMEENDIFSLSDQDFLKVISLKHVLHAWAWQQPNREGGACAQSANDYLQKIDELCVNNQSDPTVASLLLESCDLVLEAWSKSGSEGSAELAEAMFQRMKSLNQTSGNSSISTQSYTNAILAWSKCKRPQSAERAYELLLEMLKHFQQGCFHDSEPELIAFNGVISAFGRTGNPDKAEAVVWLMDEIKPLCMNLVPNTVTYNSVLHAHVKSRDKAKALVRIRAIVEYMEEKAQEHRAIKPDSFTYNTLMKAWIQSRESDLAEQAEQILQKMERLWESGDEAAQPSNRHYNVVINAYAKTRNNPYAARKARDLLQRMRNSNGRVKPDIISYTSVMECYSKSGDPDASTIVTALLEEVFELYEKTGEATIMPNLRTFTMVILTLANCNGSVVLARDLLTRLVSNFEETKDDSLRPNAYPYNYVLNCAAKNIDSKLEAFQIATRTYQEMRKSPYVQPDGYTYAFWFKCCNNLLPESDLKTKCISHAFDQCCEDGLLSQQVLTRLRMGGVIPSALGDKKQLQNLKPDELPPNWSRNVKR